MAARGLSWLAAAGIILVLSPRPGAGLEIGRVTVNSKLGEPLDAVVRIFPAPEEELDSSCLSLANQQEFSNPEHARLSGAKLTVLGRYGPIRITTADPVTDSAVSIGLRVQCEPDRVSVRPINLYLQAFASVSSTATASSTAINSSLPGTTITVRPGDSVYKLSRLIYPHDETAVANLAKAIVLTNPALFPDGRGRPLRVGERITIPDLRTVERIVSRSAAPPVVTAKQPVTAVAPSSERRAAAMKPATRSEAPAAVPEPAPVAKPAHKVVATGTLRLQMATSLDLTRTRGMSAQKRAALRQQPRAPVIDEAGTFPEIAALSSRVDRIRKLQDGINARLARLEAAASSLKNALVQTQAQRPPAPANRSAESRTQPSRRPVAPPAQTVTKPATTPAQAVTEFSRAPAEPVTDRATAPSKPTVAPRLSPLEQPPVSPPAWRSYGVIALLVVAVVALVLLARKLWARRVLSKQRTRIDAMLKQARSAATPLLGSEPAFETGGAATQSRTAPPPAEPETLEEVDRIVSEQTEPEIFDPTKTQPLVHPSSAAVPPAADTAMSAPDEPPAHLRSEMDEAMDATRSMFSDVDRFITLGRIQNAISLLEFQIKRDPTDRDSWIKLMAVYRSEGMDDDFERVYAGFRDQFGESLGY